jgi:cytidine deaminase
MKDDLIAAAEEARIHAYAPYSGYKVGAAVTDGSGRIWSGCNVENVVHGAAVCAERAAILKMVSESGSEITALALSTADGNTPCGICLQVMQEFARDPKEVRITTVADDGSQVEYRLCDLFPHGFASRLVNRTEPGAP